MPDAFGIALANEVSLGAIHKRRHLLLLGKGSNIEGKLMIDSTWKSVNKQEGVVKKLKNPDDVVYGWPPSSTSHIGRSQSDKYAFVIAVGDRRQAALVRDCFSLCLYCFSYSSSSLLQLQSLRKCIQIIIPRITLCMALALLLCTYYYSMYSSAVACRLQWTLVAAF